jgi:hypothetical protein
MVTDALFAELRLFLEEWLSFRPVEYQEEDLYAAAAVMVERLGIPVTLRIAQARALDLVFGDSHQEAEESPTEMRERALALIDGMPGPRKGWQPSEKAK